MEIKPWLARQTRGAETWEVVEGDRVIASGIPKDEAKIIEQAKPALLVLNDIWDRDNPRVMTPGLLHRTTYILKDLGWTQDVVNEGETWDAAEDPARTPGDC